MNRLRVIAVNKDHLLFDNGIKLYSEHYAECCENHYLFFDDLSLSDFDGLEFDLSIDGFFERIAGYGIALIPVVGFPVRIAGHGDNNGFYSSNLSLVLDYESGQLRTFDIEECQDINWN